MIKFNKTIQSKSRNFLHYDLHSEIFRKDLQPLKYSPFAHVDVSVLLPVLLFFYLKYLLLVSWLSFFTCLGVGKGFRGENILVSGNFSKKESQLETLTPRLVRQLVSKALFCPWDSFVLTRPAALRPHFLLPTEMLIVLMVKRWVDFWWETQHHHNNYRK